MAFKSGEVAIVTGGARGIGIGISEVLAEQGCKVVIAGRNQTDGNNVANRLKAEGYEAHYIKCDVSIEAEVKNLMEKTVEKYDRIDILINNAGVGGFNKVTETSEEEWDRCMNIDLKGVFLCSKHAIPYMQKTKKGSIVNISSVHSVKAVNACAAYDAAKGGVSSLTRQMAIDYGPEIRVNDVSPGWVHSDIVQGIFDSYDDPAAAQKSVEERLCTKFIGEPRDVGELCAFLGDYDKSRYITGSQYIIDGGLTCELERW